MIDILEQIERWRQQLLDTSKRNRLINCRIGGHGALRLHFPNTDLIWDKLLSGSSMTFRWKRELVGDDGRGTADETQQGLLFDEIDNDDQSQPGTDLQACIASPRLKAFDLLTEMTDKRLGGRLSRLSLNARTTLSEQGINSLFVAFGMLRWYESIDSEVAVRSPLLLVPVTLKRSGTDAPWTLSLHEEEVHPNHCLNQIMKSNFDLDMPEIGEEDLLDTASGRNSYFAALSEAITDGPRWEIEDIAVVGTFSFQKIAMWHDLGANADRVSEHGMCQAIAGKEVPDLTPEVELPSPRQFDEKINPKDLHLILDADSSQLEALVAAKDGLNLVVDGPPGTGKSQTIANIIAECLATDKTVLFVSEKTAALEVVKHRLDEQKLGDFCLECHSHKANKKEVIGELGRCLALPQEHYRDQTDDLERLYETREKLNAYVEALHKKRSLLGVSSFQVHGLLAEIHNCTTSRCEIPNVLDVDAATLRKITTALDRLQICREVIANPDEHPWRGCTADSHSLTLEDDVRHHFGILSQKCTTLLHLAAPLIDAELSPSPPSKCQLESTVEGIRQILELPQLPPEWFDREPESIAIAFIELDTLSRRYRDLFETMHPIREDALEAAARTFESLSESDSTIDRVRPCDTQLNLRIREYDELLELIENVRHAAQALDLLVNKVAELMHVTLDDEPSIRLLGKLLTIGGLVVQVGVAHDSWFEPNTRSKLLQDAEECVEQLARADQMKKDFKQPLVRLAYEDEGQQVAERFTQFESLWARWFNGGWKQLREEVADLYHSEPPGKTDALISDMRHLRRFHRRRSHIRRITESNADILLRDGDGMADWNRLFAILGDLEVMDSEFKVPPTLRRALTTKGAINRDELEVVLVDLDVALKQLDAKMVSLNGAYETTTEFGTRHGYRDLSAPKLLQWIAKTKNAVTNRANLFSDLQASLREGMDISFVDTDVYRTELQKILDAKQQVDHFVEQLGELAEVDGSPYLRDWHSESQLAKTYQWYLNNASMRGIPASVPLLYDSTIREHYWKIAESIDSILDEAFTNAWRFLSCVFDIAKPASKGIVISDAALVDLQEWLAARVGDVKQVHQWIEYIQIRTLLCDLQVITVVNEVENSTVALDAAADAFRCRFYRLWLDAVYATDPLLSGFNVDEHDRLIGSFRELDVTATETAFMRIRSKLLNAPQRPHSGMVNAPSSSEVGMLLHEVNKKKRHKSLRRLFKDLPTLLTRIKPCVMMSPLAVSTFFESDNLKFDVVIFDEASQVRPFDAIGAIYRGHQLIVAGDQQQLPPTTFFDRLTDDDGGDPDDEDSIGDLVDFESILDVCCTKGLPRKRLRWHYRSRREALIGFSNHHFYDNELITFPSASDVDGTGAIDFEFVEEGRWKSGSSGGYNLREAEHTAGLVIKHFTCNPQQSLGVITFNQKQQLAVLDQLTLLRKNHPEFDKFFDEENGEPFFVKNLENVQGDERDVIFLSMGYAKELSDKPLAMRFGPLNRQGGERRLNVAVTRAKHHLKMIASVTSHDLDLNRTNSVGARLLRHYLEYAERGIAVLGAEKTETYGDDYDSPFEREVAEELRRQGFDVRTQVGCSGYRIDLAIVHPEQPGKYVLGVECDGATYHSSATARDRDRLRQSVLEGLGWHIYRIWSTDWVRDRQRQIQRVREAFEKALVSPGVNHSQQANSCAIDERPRIRQKQSFGDLYGKFGYYGDISEVDAIVIEKAITSMLGTYGATRKNELLKCVAQSLGFSRLGPRIRSAIESALNNLISSGGIAARDDEVFSLQEE